MTKKTRKPPLAVRRDKLGRFVKASKQGSRTKNAVKAKPRPSKVEALRPKKKQPAKRGVPRRAKKPPAKISTIRRTKRQPIKAPVLRRKRKQPAKAPVLRRKKKQPAKAPVLRRKKKPPVKVPVLRRKKKPTVKAPVLRRKKKHPAKAPVLRPKTKRPAKVVPPKLRKKPKKGPKTKRRRYPSFMGLASQAETMIQDKLVSLGEVLRFLEPEITATTKTFINADATVDGELRVSNLPEKWRTIAGLPSIVAAISEAVRGTGAFPAAPSTGGAFWVSFGLRFGPKDMDEMMELAKNYKRFKGLLQVGAHHTTAQSLPAMLNNALAMRMFIDRIWAKRNLPPVQLLIRFVWTPQKANPGRFSGEEGSTK